MSSTMLFSLILVLYGLSVFHYLVFLLYQRKIVSSVAYGFTIAGFVCQTVLLVARGVQSGHIPITNLFESLLAFAWGTVLIFLIYEGRFGLQILGSFIMPIVLFLLILASFAQKDLLPLVPALRSRWLIFHTGFAFIAYAVLAANFAVGLMYLIQEKQLKRRTPGLFYYRLPSLEILDRINYHSLTIGFPLLTLGIITGAVWAEVAWGSYWSWDPKETWSLITWFIYAALLHSRLTVGWRGRKAAWLSILGFAAVLFTFLGVKLLGGLHSY